MADVLISNFYLKAEKKTCFDIQKDFYQLKKNCTGTEKTNSILPVVNILTNKFGHRFNGKIKNFEKKIFFFGDSFTYGLGVNYNDSFVGFVDNNILDYKIFNFAVPSYSPSVYLYQLQEMLNKNIIPNKAVLVLDFTDIHDETSRWQDSLDTKPILVSKKYKEKHRPVKEFINKNFQISKIFSATINNFNRKIKYMIKTSNNNDKNIIRNTFQASFTYTKKENLNSEWWRKGQFDSGINKIDKKLHKISKLAKKHNFQLYLLIYPWSETLQYGQKYFNWENFGFELSKKYNFTLINMFPVFNKIKDKNKYWYNKLYFMRDEHFNKNGHKIIGNYLTKHLL